MLVNGDFIFHNLWFMNIKFTVYVKVTRSQPTESFRKNCEFICFTRKTPIFLCSCFFYSFEDKRVEWNFNIPNPTVRTSLDDQKGQQPKFPMDGNRNEPFDQRPSSVPKTALLLHRRESESYLSLFLIFFSSFWYYGKEEFKCWTPPW